MLIFLWILSEAEAINVTSLTHDTNESGTFFYTATVDTLVKSTLFLQLSLLLQQQDNFYYQQGIYLRMAVMLLRMNMSEIFTPLFYLNLQFVQLGQVQMELLTKLRVIQHFHLLLPLNKQ